ncbi:MAG: hypothetical protein KatS3mg120_1620 [Erythrobacter sp.]|nr:MAG: hypothetical protein KatS3mg120_1620 [Erythrobacter sp.]
MASMGLSIDEQKAVERFRKAVVEPSQTKLVILDFWAEWCAPCKALAPVLEKVAADYAAKGVVLAKINVDEEQFIAAQFQVRSIPTVYAIFQGQPIADLTNARSESQLKAILDQLLAQLPVAGGEAGAPAGPSPAEIAQFVKMGEDALAAGDAMRAGSIFAQITEFAPDNAAAHAGLVRALVLEGRIEEARDAMAVIEADPKLAADPAVAPARAALELAGTKVDEGELAVPARRRQGRARGHGRAVRLCRGGLCRGPARRGGRHPARHGRGRPRLERGRGARQAAQDLRGHRARGRMGQGGAAAAVAHPVRVSLAA